MVTPQVGMDSLRRHHDALTAENERLRGELARLRDGNGLLVELEAVEAERQALQRRLTDALVVLRDNVADVPLNNRQHYCVACQSALQDGVFWHEHDCWAQAILTDPDNAKLLEGA